MNIRFERVVIRVRYLDKIVQICARYHQQGFTGRSAGGENARTASSWHRSAMLLCDLTDIASVMNTVDTRRTHSSRMRSAWLSCRFLAVSRYIDSA